MAMRGLIFFVCPVWRKANPIGLYCNRFCEGDIDRRVICEGFSRKKGAKEVA